MAITAGVGSAVGTGSGATLTSGTLNGCTAGRQILIAIGWEMGSAVANDRTISSITVSNSGGSESNATVIGTALQCLHSRNAKIQLAYIANLANSGNVSVTVNFAGSNAIAASSIIIREVQGGDTADFLENAGAGNAGDGSDETLSDSVTTAAANGAVFGIVFWAAGNIDSITGTGLTWTTLTMTDNFTKVDAFECLDVGAAGTKTPLVDIDTFAALGIIAASFNASGGGGGGTPLMGQACL